MDDQKQDQLGSDRALNDAVTWKLTDAKANLSRLVEQAFKGRPQRILRGGRDAVIVVAESQYRRAVDRGRTAVQLFSALRGAGLDLERDTDTGREAPL